MKIFSYYNSKINTLGDILGVKVGCFETSVGYSCLYAGVCSCYVDEKPNGARYILRKGAIRCFASMSEVRFPEVFNKRRINTVLAKSKEFYEIAFRELKQERFQVFRPHSAGDYWTMQEYLDWRNLAGHFPDVMFFGYTKNPHVFDHLMSHPVDNYKLVYSWGGIEDQTVKHVEPICYIKGKGLYVPDDVPVINLSAGEDYQYIITGRSFAIPYH